MQLITAKTYLIDSAGKKQPILFEFRLSRDYKFKDVKILSQGSCNVTIWMLLDLIIKVLPSGIGNAINVKPFIKKAKGFPEKYKYSLMEVPSGNYHYLFEEVNPSWLGNKDINFADLSAYWIENRSWSSESLPETHPQIWHLMIEDKI